MNNKEIEQYIKRTGMNSSVTVQQYADGILEKQASPIRSIFIISN